MTAPEPLTAEELANVRVQITRFPDQMTTSARLLATLDAIRAESDARVERLREAATALCQLWFTDNAPDGSQHLRKAMLDLRAALSDTAEGADKP